MKLPKLTKTTRTIIIILFLAGLVTFCIWYFPPASRITPANVGFRSSMAIWTTNRPSKGCLIATNLDWPLKLAFTCDQGTRKNTHMVKFDNLTPETTYTLISLNGPRIKLTPWVEFTTKNFSDTPPLLPNPAYGTVIDTNNFPVAGALVIIYPASPQFYYAVATRTNLKGNFDVDISSLAGNHADLIIESTINGLWNERTVPKDVHQPMPSITITR